MRPFPKRSRSAGVGGLDRPAAKPVAADRTLPKIRSASASVCDGLPMVATRSARVDGGYPPRARSNAPDRVG